MSVTINGTTGIAGVDGSASTPAVQGTDTNTGIFFPAADTIAFGEGGAEVMRLDSSANLQFNSGYGSVATAYGCRAWVNFNGTGTPAIRASGNVSSITDNGTGNFTVNFTTAMPDANYSVSGTASTLGDTNSYTHVVTTGDSGNNYGGFSTTAVRLNVYGANYSALGDANYVMACIFR
jgi:hypothetical protein